MSIRRLALRFTAIVAAIIPVIQVTAHTALAQADSASKRGPMVTRREMGILGSALAGSVLLFGADQTISDRVRTSSLHDNAVVRGLMDIGRVYGDPVVIVAGAGLWAIGEFHHDRTPRLVGMRSIEAIVASGILTMAIKDAAGRARPSTSPGNPRDFAFARGLRDGSEFESFPSGHATAAFAFASAVDAEWGRLSPGRPRWVGPVLYGLATLTATSRVFHDRHWTSDVLMGSAIGFVTGQAVVRWHADRR